MNSLPIRPSHTYTEEDWIQLRAHFMSSILVDIHLHKLAQNIGASWPIKDADETPAKYLEYSFDELADAPGLAGQPPRLQLLLEILTETASFDDPFQEMSEGKPDPERETRNTVQILEKLGISSDFPIEYIRFSPESKALCQAEGAITLSEAVTLFQRMAQQVHLSGEIREFLNALAQSDEKGIAKFLPYRPGSRGLHLPEAIRIWIFSLPDSEQETLLSPDTKEDDRIKTEQHILLQLPALLEWFPPEAVNLKEAVQSPETLKRFFHILNDPVIETAAVRLTSRYFSPEEIVPLKKSEGFLNRLMTLFRRR